MKRVIVTGATGFVGANLARRLVVEGHEVHLLVRPGYAAWRLESIRPHVHLHEAALEDGDVLTQTLARIGPEWIFHLAAYGAYPSQSDYNKMVQTNILGTANLVEASLKRGFESFVNTGSSSEYGYKDFAPSELERLEPNSHYAITKVSSTLFCRHTAQHCGVHMPTLRLYSVYGPYEEPTRLMPTLISRGLKGELPPLAQSTAARDYVYIDDVCEAYLLAALHPGKELGAIYNVGTGIQTTLLDVVSIARRELGISAEPQWGTMPDRVWETSVWIANNRKIQEELGWKPQFTIEGGFRKMVEWFQQDAPANMKR